MEEKDLKQEETTFSDEEVKTEKKKEKKVSLKEYQELEDLYQKALATAAHYQNQAKYYQAEYDKMIKFRSQGVIEGLLPTLDSFELALKYEAPNKEAENYKIGFEFINKMFMNALENEGLERIIPKVNDEFDSNTMQVVDTVETEDETLVHKVAAVMLNGYKLKDRLIRASGVKTYVKKQETIEENKEETEKLN